MFPTIPNDILEEALEDCYGNADEAALHLLDARLGQPSQARASDAGGSGMSDFCVEDGGVQGAILRRYSRRILLSGKYVDLTINRSKLWRTALGFYKNCLVMPDRLRRELRIEFDGEEGVDAGALRAEFFQILIKEMDEKLFEGR